MHQKVCCPIGHCTSQNEYHVSKPYWTLRPMPQMRHGVDSSGIAATTELALVDSVPLCPASWPPSMCPPSISHHTCVCYVSPKVSHPEGKFGIPPTHNHTAVGPLNMPLEFSYFPTPY